MSFQNFVRRLPHSTFLDLVTQTGAPDDAREEEVTGWNQRNTRDPSSGGAFWPQLTRSHQVDLCSPIPRPPSSFDRAEHPEKRKGADDEYNSALLSVHHNDLENVSEHLTAGNGVFSGNGELDISDSAWLAIKTKTQKSESVVLENVVGLLQTDVGIMLVTTSFSVDEKTIQQICSNPDPETAFTVIVKRRPAEVKVSTLSAKQKSELEKAEDKELNTFVSTLLWKRHRVKEFRRLL